MVSEQSLIAWGGLSIAIFAGLSFFTVIGVFIIKCLSSEILDDASVSDPCGCLPLSFKTRYCPCCIRRARQPIPLRVILQNETINPLHAQNP